MDRDGAFEPNPPTNTVMRLSLPFKSISLDSRKALSQIYEASVPNKKASKLE
jgi:hypothetical protein